MSKNIKEIGKELLGKSLNSFHRKTGLTQLEKNNEMQDGILNGILNGILSQVDDAYIEKTEQSNVIHLEGSGDGVVVLDSIEGNTMVNLLKDLRAGGAWVDNGNKFSLNIPTGSGQPMILGNLNYELKKDTVYTVILNVVDYTTGIPHICFMNKENNRLASTTEATTSSIGLKKFKLTTKSDVDSSILRILPRNGIDNTYSIGKDILILEGDWTDKDTHSYHEGLQSSFEEKVNNDGKYEIEILSKNKSLIDWNIENLENHHNSDFDFSVDDNAIKVRSNYQKAYGFKKGFYVQEGETYTISVEGKKTDGEYSAMYLGDETLDYFKKDTFILVPAITSSNIIDGSNYGTKVVTMVARKSGFINRWIIHSSGQNNYYWIRNVFLEKGETVSCIPHKSNKIKLLINEPLRSTPHNISDRLCIKDKRLVVERKCGEITLDGSEDWALDQCFETFGQVRIRHIAFDRKNKPRNKLYSAHYTQCKIYSDNMKNAPKLTNISTENLDTVFAGDSEYYALFVKFKNSTLGLNDGVNVANFISKVKEYLRNKNVTVVYELATPYYEEVLNEYGEPIILEGYENGTLYIDSTVIPTTTVRYTPKMESFKTLKEVNKNNNLITLDINENIIPYMMDVDYMIMEKELCLLNTKNIRKVEVLDMTSMQKRTQEMLERLIKGKTLTEQECKTRVTTYLNAGKITDEQAEELMLVISEIYN